MSSGPAYGVPSRARPDRLGWPRVLARMLLVVLPAQVVGALVAVLVLELSGALLTLPRADVKGRSARWVILRTASSRSVVLSAS
jgi:hypothetical protein